MKNISQIISSAVAILNKVDFTESNQQTVYAFEFLLLILGEKANAIIEELKKYCQKNPHVIDEVKALGFELDKTIINKKDEFNKHFRENLNQISLGKFLMLLNRIRNQLDHNIQDITEEQHHL